MKIVVNLPSINQNLAVRCVSSINSLSSLRKHCHINLIAQPIGWSINGCDSVIQIDRMNFVSMVDLRLLTVKLIDDADYYLFIDDDLVFSDDSFFEKIIDILQKYEPTVLQLFGSRYERKLQFNPINCIVTTNRGLFVKNVGFSDLYNLGLAGGCEESVIGYHALYENHKHIVVGGAPVTRSNVKHIAKDHESFIHNQEVYEQFVRKYIREKYNCQDWEVLSGFFPWVVPTWNVKNEHDIF